MSDDALEFDEPAQLRRQPAAAATDELDEYTSPVVNWRELDPDDAGPVWEELGEWVVWARERYELRAVHQCWFKHPLAVEYLSALRSAWIVLFEPEDSGLGPVTFLEKLRAATPAIDKTFGACTANSHSAIGPKQWPPLNDDAGWRELIGEERDDS